MPGWKAAPRGPKRSPTATRSGHASGSGQVGDRRPQRGDRGRPGDAHRGQARPALEAQQRRLDVRPEAAVDRARGEAVPREQELELDDVAADRAGREGARPERRSCERAERGDRPRPDGAVRDEAGPALERRRSPTFVDGPDARRPRSPHRDARARSATWIAATCELPTARADAGSSSDTPRNATTAAIRNASRHTRHLRQARRSVLSRSARLDRAGAWRSLVSALVWGTRGRRFESVRPDQPEPA